VVAAGVSSSKGGGSSRCAICKCMLKNKKSIHLPYSHLLLPPPSHLASPGVREVVAAGVSWSEGGGSSRW
jgi:hypothetical protein